MDINPEHLKFSNPVSKHIGGNLIVIHTVEQAIEWLNNQLRINEINRLAGTSHKQTFMAAKAKLQRALDARTDATLVTAQEAFEDALNSLDK